MSVLFEPIRIGNLEIRNRFVRSATGDRLDDEKGHATAKKIELYAKLASGGIGLIITWITSVFHFPEARWPNLSDIGSEESIPHFKKLVDAVHSHGARIAPQLFHRGREEAAFLEKKGMEAWAPSLVEEDPFFNGPHRAMAEEEIWTMVRAFGDGARRTKEAGFDAVQLHGAHGYLLSQFLSPHTNLRRDEWGGDLEGRLRFHREILRDIRSKVGEDYPVMIKLGVQDAVPDGLRFEEGKRAAQLLAEWGFDALEISQGIRGRTYDAMEFKTEIDTIEQEAYFRDWAREIKQVVNVPVMMVGGLRSYELCEEVIQNREADFVSMCRPFIREPYLVNDWRDGDLHRATCISCNDCLERMKEDLVCWLDV
jgi:2,4-dienoyl-CoA reductase-like NADH-dependent reductase (Old Yellow Enzyme family)